MPKKEYGRNDWYRRTTWDTDDQEAFFARLKRSRSQFHKAQYLRVQAVYLEDEFPEEALGLLKMIREEYPEPSQLSLTYLQTAECLVALERKEEAIPWFRKVLEQEAIYKGVRTYGYLEYPAFIVANEMKELFAEAKAILLNNDRELSFPNERYQWNMGMAVIEWEEGNQEKASHHACEAIKASKEEHSGFRYHPTLGLVEKQDKRIRKLLKRISKHGGR